jgi:hypothetical protein
MDFSLKMIDELLRAIKSLDLGKGKSCDETSNIVARAFGGINVVIVQDHWHSVLGGDGVHVESVDSDFHGISESPQRFLRSVPNPLDDPAPRVGPEDHHME